MGKDIEGRVADDYPSNEKRIGGYRRTYADENRILDRYFHEIGDSAGLSSEKEYELAQRIKDGDEGAFWSLVKANLRFVISVAKEYQNRGLPLEDLISAGNLGLITAAGRFDGTKGYKFITYAVWWIRQTIFKELTDNSRIVRLPLSKIELIHRINNALTELGITDLTETSDVEKIASYLGTSSEAVIHASKIARPKISLDGNSDDERTLYDSIEDKTLENPEESAERESLREDLSEALNGLDERERNILNLYFGLDGEIPISLEQIGKRIGLTRERVRQIKKRVLQRLRHPEKSAMLREHYG